MEGTKHGQKGRKDEGKRGKSLFEKGRSDSYNQNVYMQKCTWRTFSGLCQMFEITE